MKVIFLLISMITLMAFAKPFTDVTTTESQERYDGWLTDPDECVIYIGPFGIPGSKIECHSYPSGTCAPKACSQNIFRIKS